MAVISRMDLPKIADAIRELYRIIETPPQSPWTPPQWLIEKADRTRRDSPEVQSVEKPSHSTMIQFAKMEVLERLMPGACHFRATCPEIENSQLDMEQKAALIELRTLLIDPFLGVGLQRNPSARIQFCLGLQSVLTSIEAPPAKPTPAIVGNSNTIALLSVFSNGVSDERIDKAAAVLANDDLTANEKLQRIDELMPLPPTASAKQLGVMLGISKQAVMKSDWWSKNRKNGRNTETDRRRQNHKERAKSFEKHPDNDN